MFNWDIYQPLSLDVLIIFESPAGADSPLILTDPKSFFKKTTSKKLSSFLGVLSENGMPL